MDRLRRVFYSRQVSEAAYEPIESEGVDSSDSSTTQDVTPKKFSWVEYGTFVLLGVSMLWAW